MWYTSIYSNIIVYQKIYRDIHKSRLCYAQSVRVKYALHVIQSQFPFGPMNQRTRLMFCTMIPCELLISVDIVSVKYQGPRSIQKVISAFALCV